MTDDHREEGKAADAGDGEGGAGGKDAGADEAGRAHGSAGMDSAAATGSGGGSSTEAHSRGAEGDPDDGTGDSRDSGRRSNADKPAILQETEFVVEEGILHRTFRTGAIWMNKLFFSSAFLLAVWLLVGYAQGLQDCAGGTDFVGNNSSQELDIVKDGTCSVLLTTTSVYLGSMTVLSFVASIAFGLLGLVIGKRVIETTPTAEEVGAEEGAHDAGAEGESASAPGDAGDEPAEGRDKG